LTQERQAPRREALKLPEEDGMGGFPPGELVHDD
jgi:hypothetical protein